MKRIIVLSSVIVSLVLSACMLSQNVAHAGTVIVLNGPSGSGKSSIQKAFQKLMMPNLWVKVGIDNLFDSPMPDINLENLSFWQSPNPIRWVEESQDADGNKIITLLVGDQGKKVAYAMNSAIAAYAQNGCNVIVDYIAYDQDWLRDLEQKLAGFKTYYVAVEIPLETLEQREEARGTSPKGHARSHYASVYGDKKYDLVVSTANQTAQEIAQQLKDSL
jgi:chloramphenicol 3-O phosphotransferase